MGLKKLLWFSACSAIKLLEESILFVWVVLIYRCTHTRFLLSWKNVSKHVVNYFCIFRRGPGQNWPTSLPHYRCNIIQVLFWFSGVGGVGRKVVRLMSLELLTNTRLCHFLFKENPAIWFSSRFLNYYISNY